MAYTLFAILTITALLGYGAIGMREFGAVFLPFEPFTCGVLTVARFHPFGLPWIDLREPPDVLIDQSEQLHGGSGVALLKLGQGSE